QKENQSLLDNLQESFKSIEVQITKTKKKKKSSTEEDVPNVAAQSNIEIVIDRFTVQNDDSNLSRIADSVQTAFFEGHSECRTEIYNGDLIISTSFSNRFTRDGIDFEEPSTQLFSFNNPYGACGLCEGFGSIIGIDEDLVMPDKSLSVYDGAIFCWSGEQMKE